MLDFKVFIQGMNALKGYYVNWNFDANNELALKLWYKKFQDLDNATYQALIEAYVDEKIYAPNSPADLLNIIPKELSPDEAWERILLIIKRSFNNTNFLTNIQKEEPQLMQFVHNWNIEEVPEDTQGNKCWGYHLGKIFKRQYQEYLANKQLVRIGDRSIKLLTN